MSKQNKNIPDPMMQQMQAMMAAMGGNKMKKKRLIRWIITFSIFTLLYILLWKYSWIKWTLILVIPVFAFSLYSIVYMEKMMRFLLKRQMKKIGMRK